MYTLKKDLKWHSTKIALIKLLFAGFLTFLGTYACCAQDVVQEMKKLHKKKTALDTTGWKKEGVFALSVQQTSLSDWPTGGENFIIGIMSIVNYSLHHRFGHYSFDAYSDIELGFVEASSFKEFRKTNDRCDLTFEFEHEMGKNYYYGFLSNFNSQFLPGYDYKNSHRKISNFLTPGKIILSPGFDKKYQSADTYLSVFVSPLTSRWILKTDNAFFKISKFGVDSAHSTYNEIGPYFSVHVNHNFSKHISYVGRLDLFSNYKHKPNNLDVLCNTLLSLKISKVFAATFLLDIVYDDDIKNHPQIFENIGLGLRLNL